MHFFYTFMLIFYVKTNYMIENEYQMYYAIALAVGLIYPACYDFIQLYKTGMIEYLSEAWNYADLLYIFGSLFNIVLQLFLGPYNIASRVQMCIIVALLTVKTFFFLRIFPILTPIVVMITRVVYDLRIFLFFYMILIWFFGLAFAVIGLGNEYSDKVIDPEGHAKYYMGVGLMMGEFFWVFRSSVGDFHQIYASK